MTSRILAYIALGSNLGDRAGHIRAAIGMLREEAAIEFVAVSPFYENPAVTRPGAPAQPDFLNAVASVATSLAPEALLDRLHDIEGRLGRKASERGLWTPRTLDLDILLYGDEQVETRRLSIPHPRLAERRFVLQPLADLAPLARVPHPFDATVQDLLAQCADRGALRPIAESDLSQQALWPEAAESTTRIPDRLPTELRYIAIDGVIGAGKTTLARLFAERVGARTVMEQFEENPFLERFYADMPRWAFQTQLAFLASRFRQQQQLSHRDLFQEVVVSDYTFDKDRIFARLTLSGDELALYDTMFGIMQTSVPVPDLVVYLQSTTDRLMRQIKGRGRSYEEDMDRDYIHSLNEAYNDYFFHYDKSPLLIVNAARLDFVNSADDLEELIGEIVRPRHPGTTYYSPGQ